MTEYEDGISPARMRQGRREANAFCHCGKLRSRHMPREVILCKKEQKTETVVRRMTENEINGMMQAKI